MSNGSGSELLNKVLKVMVNHAIACDTVKRKVIREIIEIAKKEDCSEYEILENLGRDVGICESCLKDSDELKEGLCSKCIEESCR